MVKCTNLVNNRGNAVKNQIIITNDSDNSISFQSYDSLICEVFMDGGLGYEKVIHFGKNWNYSATTSKHLHYFLKNYANICELSTKKDILEAIERGHARANESIAVIYDENMK